VVGELLEPPVSIADDSSANDSLPVLGLFIRSKYPTWVIIIIKMTKNADFTVFPWLTLPFIVNLPQLVVYKQFYSQWAACGLLISRQHQTC
jgi:hypothetical protein